MFHMKICSVLCSLHLHSVHNEHVYFAQGRHKVKTNNKRRYVCLFICLSVVDGRQNGWADQDNLAWRLMLTQGVF